MGISLPPPTDSREYRTATVEVHLTEPALVPAAFDLMRLLARASDMSDVSGIHIHMKLEFSGNCYNAQVTQFDSRLDQMWLGDVTNVKVRE